MDSPSSSPSKVLHPLSPERINQQTLPNSPSTASEFLRLHRKANRGLSDVQAKVAYLNNLSRGDSPASAQAPTSAGGAAALQRAILGREEAESALARVSSQLSEAQSRERRISERLESLLEELQTAKERQAHERLVFEKEIRKARKEAFRAGSTLVKVQEELKNTRNEAKNLKEEIQSEREAKEKAKQEAFERAYAVAGLTEELQELKGRLRTAEAKIRSHEIKRQDIGRLSLAEGDLALIMTPTPRSSKRPAPESNTTPIPGSTEAMVRHDTPSKRQRLSDIPLQLEEQDYEELGAPLTVQDLIDDLQYDLEMEKKERKRAEDLIELLQVECMFKICSCRVLEKQENEARARKQRNAVSQQETQGEVEEHKHENGVSCREEIASQQMDAEPANTGAEDEEADRQLETQAVEEETEGQLEEGAPDDGMEETIEMGSQDEEEEEPLIAFSPTTGTFHTIPSPARSSPRKQPAASDSQDLQPLVAGNETELEAQDAFPSPVSKYESHSHKLPFEPILQSEAYSRDLTPGSCHSPMMVEAQWQTQLPSGNSVEDVTGLSSVKRIPLRTEDQVSNRFSTVPGTPISREQALAQIRARRGRTSAMKRSASANDAALRLAGLSTTPVRAARRIPGIQRTDPRSDGPMRNRRDLSAPLRMSHQ